MLLYNYSLREKCPNADLNMVRIFLYSCMNTFHAVNKILILNKSFVINIIKLMQHDTICN